MRARTFDEVEFRAIAWLVNQQLNPRGYHFATITKDDDQVVWVVMGDGKEVATSGEDPDFVFRLLNELLGESAEFYKDA